MRARLRLRKIEVRRDSNKGISLVIKQASLVYEKNKNSRTLGVLRVYGEELLLLYSHAKEGFESRVSSERY